MKKLLMIVFVTVMAFTLAIPAFASEEHDCAHDGTTIESLHHCVEHAAEMGHITKSGVANSVLVKLDAAQTAYDDGNTVTATNLLYAFINEVNGQAGKSIDAEHAMHLIEHAQNVIDALSD